MRIAILSLFTPNIESLNAITAPRKQAYADRWGYTFINHSGSLDEGRPPAWSKIRLIQRHLADYDWVYWIDADATIMNPAIRLESFLRDCDLILAQECHLSPFGNRQLNTGSFFIRNCQWSQHFLKCVDQQTDLKDHPFWEQAAVRRALDENAEGAQHVYVETDQTKFNSFFGNYSKGDFVFHAYTFTHSLDAKMNLLCRVIEEDRVIFAQSESDVSLYFLINRLTDDYRLLLEFGVPSLLENSAYLINYWFRFLETTPSELDVLHYGAAYSGFRERLGRISDELHKSTAAVVAFTLPDIQFLRSNWKRRCLVRLGDRHGLFLENGRNRGHLGDSFFVLRVVPEVRAFFRDAATFLQADSTPRTVDSFAKLVEYLPPRQYGCEFDLFPKAEVSNIAQPSGGLDWIFNIVVHSAECVNDRGGKWTALERVRQANQSLMEGLRRASDRGQ